MTGRRLCQRVLHAGDELKAVIGESHRRERGCSCRDGVGQGRARRKTHEWWMRPDIVAAGRAHGNDLSEDAVWGGVCERVCQRWRRIARESSVVKRRKRDEKWAAYEAGMIKPRVLEGHNGIIYASSHSGAGRQDLL